MSEKGPSSQCPSRLLSNGLQPHRTCVKEYGHPSPHFDGEGTSWPVMPPKSLVSELSKIPLGMFEGANRYDTDDEIVLTVWGGGKTFDLRAPKTDKGSS